MQCCFPQNLVANIKTPMFLLNAAYDAWQVIFLFLLLSFFSLPHLLFSFFFSNENPFVHHETYQRQEFIVLNFNTSSRQLSTKWPKQFFGSCRALAYLWQQFFEPKQCYHIYIFIYYMAYSERLSHHLDDLLNTK